jgi:hypothetical protein
MKTCEVCGGAGWAWADELRHAVERDPCGGIDDTKYTCDWCDGKGRIPEEGDEIDPDWFQQ